MPSEFFNQLVAARREGTVPQPDDDAKEPNPLQVNFYPAPFDGLATCGRCCALLVETYAPTHADWHRQQGH